MYAERQIAAVAALDEIVDPSPSAPGFSPDPQTLSDNRIVGFSRMDEQVHSFVVMRSHLLKHVTATGQRVFAVTSVEPGDGKTHIAVNLAAALSRIHPTVLVELDLRWPSVSRRLGLPGLRFGIDDHLAGTSAVRDTAVGISGFDLTLHPARKPRFNAEDLLASPRLADFVAGLRAAKGAPICLIDTPPALVNDDLMLIARAVDGVLLVVQEARTRARALVEIVGSLSPTPIVGSILNMSISSPRPSTGYGYYNRADDSPPA